jgi:hypothetical protein
MIKNLLVFLLITRCSLTYAQTIKTDVLVIGAEASGVAAAVQSARSKLKTILIEPQSSPGAQMPQRMLVINSNSHLPSGMWGEFRNRIHEFYKGRSGFDTAYYGPLKFEGATAGLIFKKIIDTVKNLTVYANSQFTAIKKDGDRWDVIIKQNEKTITVKAQVVVDATENGDVAAKLNATAVNGVSNISNPSKIFRTSVASADNLSFIPLRAVVLKGVDNILVTEKALPAEKDIQYLPLQLELGQGVGATAAYCAFFKTDTKNLKVHIIQGEILDFKGNLLPFADVPQKDHDWRAIEQVGAMGLLKGAVGEDKNAQLLFAPDVQVITAEIKPVLTEIYTRAFLWFNREKPGEKFTVGNMLSFISDYTLTEPLVLKAALQKTWKTQYKFKLDFDPARAITRREFAVLANRFLNPFARTIDLDGRLVN